MPSFKLISYVLNAAGRYADALTSRPLHTLLSPVGKLQQCERAKAQLGPKSIPFHCIFNPNERTSLSH